MSGLIAVALVLVMLGVVVLTVRKGPRYRGLGGAMNVFDEIYHPGAHSARVEIEAYQEHADPTETPDDHKREK